MTPDVALTGLKAAASWLGSIVTWRQQNAERHDAQADAALASLTQAALETRHYLAEVRDNRQLRDRQKERDLALLWGAAGNAMAHIDPDLSLRYLGKADYWSDTEGWTAADNDERLIQLDDVVNLGRAALLPNRSR